MKWLAMYGVVCVLATGYVGENVNGAGGFSVGELRTTRMAGSEDEMRAESIHFDLLRQARKYAVTKTTLTLKDEGNQEILVFEAR